MFSISPIMTQRWGSPNKKKASRPTRPLAVTKNDWKNRSFSFFCIDRFHPRAILSNSWLWEHENEKNENKSRKNAKQARNMLKFLRRTKKNKIKASHCLASALFWMKLMGVCFCFDFFCDDEVCFFISKSLQKCDNRWWLFLLILLNRFTM